LYGSVVLRDLHSFPTRRSSDLGIALASGFCSLWFGLLGTTPWAVLLTAGCVYGVLVSADSAIYSTAVTELAPRDRIGSAQAVQRSEEHTSELQSRENLVCRLLL